MPPYVSVLRQRVQAYASLRKSWTIIKAKSLPCSLCRHKHSKLCYNLGCNLIWYTVNVSLGTYNSDCSHTHDLSMKRACIKIHCYVSRNHNLLLIYHWNVNSQFMKIWVIHSRWIHVPHIWTYTSFVNNRNLLLSHILPHLSKGPLSQRLLLTSHH